MQVVVRRFNPDTDSGLIYSSYAKGVYHGSYEPINPPDDPAYKSKWFKEFHKTVESQLKNCTVLIACMSDSPQTILGYAIIDGLALNFVYVKELFRNKGIATLLLKNHPITTYTHITKVGHAILNKGSKNE